MERITRKKFDRLGYVGLAAIAAIFAAMAVILFLERSGIQYQYNATALDYLPQQQQISKAQALTDCEKNCLVLYEGGNAASMEALDTFQAVLTDMKVGYDAVDIARNSHYDFGQYSTAIVLLSDLSKLGDRLFELDAWVQGGGGALFPMTLEREIYFDVMASKFGILESSYDYQVVDSIYVTPDFMLGGGRAFTITDPWDSALGVLVRDGNGVKVHAYTADQRRVALIWETQYGAGKFVFDNFGIYTKEWRGFYAASYSLLGSVCAYPVINASNFYLDDFPSQVPDGNSQYVWRDYGISIRDFYVNVWWPDMMALAEQYGLKYTGLAILCYDDNVDGTTPSQADEQTFLYFGNMLLRMGGEIGYHGYNHQPLCLDDCDYQGVYDYKTWESEAAMKSGLDKLMELCDKLFPGVKMSVYVPPSNLLSDGAEAFLAREYPNIRTISGIYFPDAMLDFSCTQEFDVTPEGVVAQPRITSGCDLDPYMQIAAISELNFHYVNSHFTHPDDALDPDRGAEMGWETLKTRFTQYLDWLYTAAPNLRDFTGSETSAAVQRFAALTVSTQVSPNRVDISLGNFHDEAQLLVRFNAGQPRAAEGGTLEHLTGSLYLLQASSPQVTIALDTEAKAAL